ncbi:hypothetical protein JOC86_000121 [Bacillus pakistanensis]|uniref:Uncharacterized protein n=1 Tax=Rossellomorea pakistanensis TaxID=992288 RepID=A0ABS2N6Y3_9BACI|nr:hypothetical protein [Bacillus pakistanensis]
MCRAYSVNGEELKVGLIVFSFSFIQVMEQVCSIRNHKSKSIYYKIRFDVLMSNKKVMQKIEMMHISIITRQK